MNHFKYAWKIAIVATILSEPVAALPDDRDQLIEIESETAEFRELEGVTIYAGNVRMQQGSILLEAERVTLYTSDGKVSRLFAEGGAYYEQLPELNGDKVIAKGGSIEYELADDVIRLRDNASLTQEGATLNGNQITYNVKEQLLKANGNKPEEAEGRIRMTLPPLNNDS